MVTGVKVGSKKKAGGTPRRRDKRTPGGYDFTAGGGRLTRLALTDKDFAAIKAIGAAYGHRFLAPAVRLAVRNQDDRDTRVGVPSKGWIPADVRVGPPGAALDRRVYEGIVAGVWGSVKAEPTATVPHREWSCVFFPEHADAAIRVCDRWGMVSDEGEPFMVRAVRFAVRVEAMLCGFNPPGGTWL